MGSKKDRFTETELRSIVREEITAALEKSRTACTCDNTLDCE